MCVYDDLFEAKPVMRLVWEFVNKMESHILLIKDIY
jgi:hypothetical protein